MCSAPICAAAPLPQHQLAALQAELHTRASVRPQWASPQRAGLLASARKAAPAVRIGGSVRHGRRRPVLEQRGPACPAQNFSGHPLHLTRPALSPKALLAPTRAVTMCRRALLLLLCLLACAVTLQAAVVQPYCGALTGVAGCVECSATKLCYFCNYLSSPVWTSPGPKLTEVGRVPLPPPLAGDAHQHSSSAALLPPLPAVPRSERRVPRHRLDRRRHPGCHFRCAAAAVTACALLLNSGCSAALPFAP